MLEALHHVALICTDYGRSKRFYTEVLGLEVLAEHYRAERDSWKLDLGIGGRYVLELFSFADAPARPDMPEARGLRHLAFRVQDIDAEIRHLRGLGVVVEAVRIDPFTGKHYTFFRDPDGQPLELYEA